MIAQPSSKKMGNKARASKRVMRAERAESSGGGEGEEGGELLARHDSRTNVRGDEGDGVGEGSRSRTSGRGEGDVSRSMGTGVWRPGSRMGELGWVEVPKAGSVAEVGEVGLGRVVPSCWMRGEVGLCTCKTVGPSGCSSSATHEAGMRLGVGEGGDGR